MARMSAQAFDEPSCVGSVSSSSVSLSKPRDKKR